MHGESFNAFPGKVSRDQPVISSIGGRRNYKPNRKARVSKGTMNALHTSGVGSGGDGLAEADKPSRKVVVQAPAARQHLWSRPPRRWTKRNVSL